MVGRERGIRRRQAARAAAWEGEEENYSGQRRECGNRREERGGRETKRSRGSAPDEDRQAAVVVDER